MDVPEFLKRPPEEQASAPAANKRGEGFHFLRVRPKIDIGAAITSRRARIALFTGIGTLVAFTVVTQINADNAFIMLAVLGVGALLVYDILSRRHWENTLTEQMRALSHNHDRLVREVARNRGDIMTIKEGLHDTATAVQDMGRNHTQAHSVEARMIETIITQLGAMGQKPRTQLSPVSIESASALSLQVPATAAPIALIAENDPVDDILQLEVAPPPRLPDSQGALEAALGPNFNMFSDTVVLELIRHAVRHDHLDVFAQPVVSLPQRKLRMYEIFARLRANAGTYIPAARYLDLAQKESLLPAIDNLLLLRGLQILRDRRADAAEVPYILNITGATLNDTGFMNDLVTFLAQHRRLAGQLVFELPLEDAESPSKTLDALLDGISRLGCRFSVDQVRKRRIDVARLRARNIRFLKLDAAWLLREAAQNGGPARIIRLKKQLDKSGIDLIVEKIENERQLTELLDFGIDFGQGFLFGKPDLHAVYHDRERRQAVAG